MKFQADIPGMTLRMVFDFEMYLRSLSLHPGADEAEDRVEVHILPCVVRVPDAAQAAGQLNAGAVISAFQYFIRPRITEGSRLLGVSKRYVGGFAAGRGNVHGFFLCGIINGVKPAVIHLVSDVVFGQRSAGIVPVYGRDLADKIA